MARLRLNVTWPAPGEAWLDGVAGDDAGGDADLETTLRALQAEGASVVRWAVPAAVVLQPAATAPFPPGAAPVAAWRRIAFDPTTLAGEEDPALPRVRRLAAGQWRNPRVRLGLQAVIERHLPPDARRGTRLPWGLIAADPQAFPSMPLHAFTPFGLQALIESGQMLAAGDPVQPQGVMVLYEPAPPAGPDAPLAVRWLAGDAAAARALLAYLGRRARRLQRTRALASLPAALVAPLLQAGSAVTSMEMLTVLQWPDPDAAGTAG